MKLTLRTLALVGCALWIQGCTLPSPPYADAKSAPPLVLPEGIEIADTSDLYQLPEVVQSVGNALGKVVRPRNLVDTDADSGQVKMLRIGVDYWVSVDATTPERLWSIVELYLRNRPEGLGVVDGEIGVLRSGARDDGSILEISVEQGLRPLTSEVLLRHLVAANSGDEVAGEGNQELAVLEELVQFIANNRNAVVEASLLAQNIRSKTKSRLISGSPSRLVILLPYKRLWATLTRVVKRSGIEIVDRNRDKRELILSVHDEDITGIDALVRFRLKVVEFESGYELIVELRPDEPLQIDDMVDRIINTIYRNLS